MIQTYRPPRAKISPLPPLDTVIEGYGAWRVFTAAAGALLKNRRSRPGPGGVTGLSPHLRRDLGFPPEHKAPNYWDL